MMAFCSVVSATRFMNERDALTEPTSRKAYSAVVQQLRYEDMPSRRSTSTYSEEQKGNYSGNPHSAFLSQREKDLPPS
jgi:hypothetical protein